MARRPHGQLRACRKKKPKIHRPMGTQMAWILRPFIGDPRLPFAWFRAHESNFAAAVVEAIVELFS
ncbi:MAG: hypothetical protein V3W41_15735 [Planctomycetota bacterium]